MEKFLAGLRLPTKEGIALMCWLEANAARVRGRYDY